MDSGIFDKILSFLVSFFGKNEAPVPAPVTPEAPKPMSAPEVDWNNPQSKISQHFTVKDATYLNSWKAFHHPTDEQKQAILALSILVDKAAEVIAAKIGKPCQISVHAWMRPDPAICPGNEHDGQDYNKWVYWNEVWKNLSDAEKALKHVPLSPHKSGHAVDFHVIGFEGPEGCAKIREMLIPHLEELGLRMENIAGGWVHLDNLPVIHERFFKP